METEKVPRGWKIKKKEFEMKLIKNRDRTGYDDKHIWNGYRTEDGKYYILKENDGYTTCIHIVSKEGFERIYDERGNKREGIAEHSISKLNMGLSEESAHQLLRKWKSSILDEILTKIKLSNKEYGYPMSKDDTTEKIDEILREYNLEDDYDALDDFFSPEILDAVDAIRDAEACKCGEFAIWWSDGTEDRYFAFADTANTNKFKWKDSLHTEDVILCEEGVAVLAFEDAVEKNKKSYGTIFLGRYGDGGLVPFKRMDIV